tara:strand:+ start:441 stop:686 length:246 start_codon:yes stop_codon:yes gene_type:complete
MEFEWSRQQKTLDQFFEIGTENAHYVVQEFYNVADAKELSQEQVEEIFIYSESDKIDDMLGVCLRNVVNYWQNENDNFEIM